MTNVNLIGVEEVSRAGHTMRAAAEDMQRAASSIAHTLEMHQRWMDDWLSRFEGVMQPPPPPKPAPTPWDEGSWQVWSGGFPPADDDLLVWVKLRDGSIKGPIQSKSVNWRHYGKRERSDVMAWQRATTPAG